MVQRKDYTLEEGSTGRDLNKDLPLYCCLRRGMKVYMSMIFQSTEVVVGACPRCHTVTDSPQDVNIQWYMPQKPQKYVLTVPSQMEDCGMWFRVQKQVIKTPHMDPTSRGGDNRPDETPVRQETTAVASMPVTPGDFQRVRLLSHYELPMPADARDFDPEPLLPIPGDHSSAELQGLEFAQSPEVSIPQLQVPPTGQIPQSTPQRQSISFFGYNADVSDYPLSYSSKSCLHSRSVILTDLAAVARSDRLRLECCKCFMSNLSVPIDLNCPNNSCGSHRRCRRCTLFSVR